MAKKGTTAKPAVTPAAVATAVHAGRPSSLLDTRVVYCGLRRAQSSRDNLEQLAKLPNAWLRRATSSRVDLTGGVYIDPAPLSTVEGPFNSNRNGGAIWEVFWGETTEKRAFDYRHASTQAYIDYMRPRCVQLARVLKKTGSFYYHCDWHASYRFLLRTLVIHANFAVGNLRWGELPSSRKL